MSFYKDSICVSLDLMRATCKSGCDYKYARKLVQDYVKEVSGFKGSWTVSLEDDDGHVITFKLLPLCSACTSKPCYPNHKLKETL